MSKIIFLNGCDSAGKTSITKAIQYLSDELWISFGVDSFIDMLAHTKQDQYFNFESGSNERGSLTSTDTTEKGAEFFNIMPEFAKLFASKGQNFIIDEVLFDEEVLKAYAKNLSNHTVYHIGIFCDLPIMQEREILRGDRCIGLANDQLNRVHQGTLNFYDFTVDTTSISNFYAAEEILAYIRNKLNPLAFNNLLK